MSETSRKLLIIDDDTPVRHSIAAFLEDSGYEVLEAEDAQTGLALFEREAVELVITDLRMPGLDGLGLLKSLGVNAAHVPVIVISGAGVMSDVVAALRLGASDYLIKPIVDMTMLEHSVQRALEHCDVLAQNQKYRARLEAVNKNLRDNLRVLERDQLAGRQVQRRLLPKPLSTAEGYHIAHHIAPSLYLSGDFVDYAHINKRYLAFYLADVSGHGASSAFVTIWLKHVVSRMVREEGLFGDQQSFAEGANQMLQDINRELHETRLNHHLTFFVGVVDTHSHQMHYVVAGHLPMPVLVTDKGSEFLTGSGKPVGIFKETRWQIHSRQLPERFSLVCCSDGVLEILPPGELQQKENYLLELVAQRAQSVESVCDALAIKQMSETPDDIAILTLTRGY